MYDVEGVGTVGASNAVCHTFVRVMTPLLLLQGMACLCSPLVLSLETTEIPS